MRLKRATRLAFGFALLSMGGAMPVLGWAHLEGTEAADPATPAAVLRLSSAATRYAALDAKPLSWRALFDAGRGVTADAGMGSSGTGANAHQHAGHANGAQAPQTTLGR